MKKHTKYQAEGSILVKNNSTCTYHECTAVASATIRKDVLETQYRCLRILNNK